MSLKSEEVAFVGAVACIAAIINDDDDDDDDDNVENNVRAYCRRKSDITVDTNGFRVLGDPEFQKHFRLNRLLFEKLLIILGNHMQARGTLKRIRKGLDLSIMMTLWMLASQDTLRSVKLKFGVPFEGTVHYHYKKIIEALREVAPLFIQWPDPIERDNIKAQIEQKYGYPGVVGCIDGSHIYISAPLIQPQRYVNRFTKHSILLQGVCDHRGVFRDIYVGEPGSVHDARMFQRSPLSNNLLRNANMLSHGEHILGDGAYMLTDKVITPYRDNGRLTRRQRRHNYKHASARACIERAFAFDKGLWRRQKLMLVYSPKYLIDSVVSSCVLSNFILLKGEPYRDLAENDEPLVPTPAVNEELGGNHQEMVEEEDEGENDVPEVDPALREARRAGQQKRDFIAFSLYPYAE